MKALAFAIGLAFSLSPIGGEGRVRGQATEHEARARGQALPNATPVEKRGPDYFAARPLTPTLSPGGGEGEDRSRRSSSPQEQSPGKAEQQRSPVSLRFESAVNDPLPIALVAEARDQTFWRAGSVEGLSHAAQPWFGLWLGEGKPGAVALAGTYSLNNSQLRFRPSLPLLPGQSYTARLELPGVSLRAEHRTAASAPAAAPKLLAIYPTSDRLPANHLKFYLVFSEAMESGTFLQHCRLVDARGREVEAPFRETELWSPDGRRLTLWFHPGRQKTGVNLNVEFGPVLTEGEEYRLVIDGRWRSARGAPLGSDVTKTFRAITPLHEQLIARDWKIHAPAAGTREPLRVVFPHPLDWATLHRMLRVASATGEVAGAIAVERGEQEWRFVPEKPWSSGPHELRVGTAIEDHAGNSLARPFEVNLQQRALPPVAPEIGIPFSVR
jgi:hypothetical protein